MSGCVHQRVTLKNEDVLWKQTYYAVLILDWLHAWQDQQQNIFTVDETKQKTPNKANFHLSKESAIVPLFCDEMLTVRQIFCKICPFPLHHFSNSEMGYCFPTAALGGLSPGKDVGKVQWRIPPSLELLHVLTFVPCSLLGQMFFSFEKLWWRVPSIFPFICFSDSSISCLHVFWISSNVSLHFSHPKDSLECPPRAAHSSPGLLRFLSNWPLLPKNVLRRVLPIIFYICLPNDGSWLRKGLEGSANSYLQFCTNFLLGSSCVKVEWFFDMIMVIFFVYVFFGSTLLFSGMWSRSFIGLFRVICKLADPDVHQMQGQVQTTVTLIRTDTTVTLVSAVGTWTTWVLACEQERVSVFPCFRPVWCSITLLSCMVCLRKLHRPRTVHLSLIFYTWPHTTVENPFFLPAFFLAEGIYLLTHKIVLGKIVPKISI